MKFRALLADVAASSAPAKTSDEATLLRVARGVALNPAMLDRLLAAYGAPAPEHLQNRALLPPPPQTIHLTEAYRATWEALLLAPISEQTQFMQSRFVITDALAKIGSQESLPVLELAFSMTCQEGVVLQQGDPALEKQFRIMECLNRYANQESLAVILRCLTRAQTGTGGQLPKISGHDLREWVVRFLTDEEHYNTGERWRQVLSKFPQENLPSDQRELLDRAMRH